MRQYIILFITLLLVIIMYIIQVTYLEETKEYMLADIYEIEWYINEDNYEKARTSFSELDNNFKIYKGAWDSYADHEHVEDIEEYICMIGKYIEQKEKTDVLVNTACLANKLNHVLNSERLDLANIF